MANTTEHHSSGGIGFVGLLTLVFITLKLLDKLAWSWWWVLSPLWITTGLVLLGLAGCFAWLVYAEYRNGKRRERQRNQIKRVA